MKNFRGEKAPQKNCAGRIESRKRNKLIKFEGFQEYSRGELSEQKNEKKRKW